MFKRIILTVVLALTLSSVGNAESQLASTYRALAKSYLSKAVEQARKTYEAAPASGSIEANYAYFYAIYSKYYSELQDAIAQAGNKTLSDIFAYYAYLFAAYAQQYAMVTYQKSSAEAASGAYASYLYNYLGYLYSYLAYLQK